MFFWLGNFPVSPKRFTRTGEPFWLGRFQWSGWPKRSLSVVRRWSRDLISGVAYLHSINILHRDLKPSNLLIFTDMALKLVDFGLAREATPKEQLPVRREICTLWYRAPELIMGATHYREQVDVWSAGSIMLELLVGSCAMAGRIEDVCKVPPPHPRP